MIRLVLFLPLLMAWQLASGQVFSTDSTMVLIPSGNFKMGKFSDNPSDYQYVHSVNIDSFWMDIHPVSNAKYYAFCQAMDYKLPEFWGMAVFKSGLDFPDYPVVGISWYDAQQYAKWCGKQLATEAQWEYAARGGLYEQDYPWGNDIDPDFACFKSAQREKGVVALGQFKANAYGLYDMAGNVWEWINDCYQYDYYEHSPEDNPKGPEHGRSRVIRGGSWHSGAGCCKVYHRNALPSNWVDMAVGFRCVKKIE